MKPKNSFVVLKQYRLALYKKRFEDLMSSYKADFSSLDKPARDKIITEAEELIGLVENVGEMGESLRDEIEKFLDRIKGELEESQLQNPLIASINKRWPDRIITIEPVVGRPNPVDAAILKRLEIKNVSPATHHVKSEKNRSERFKK